MMVVRTISHSSVLPTALIALGSPAWSDRLTCDLATECTGTECTSKPVSLSFEIDRNQFVDAINTNEPPRRKVTLVQMGDQHFPAEPFLIGDVRGFWAEGLGGSHSIFVVNADATAKFSNPEMGITLTGTCEDQD